MAVKFTLDRLSTVTGISPDELKELLKSRGVSVDTDNELTKEQVDIIKDSIKNRKKVSVETKLGTQATANGSQTLITRRASASVKPKLTLPKRIKDKPPAQSANTKKPATPKEPETPVEAIPSPQEEVTPVEVAPKPVKKPEVTSTVSAIELNDETSLAELATKTKLSETDLAQVFFNHGYMIKKNDPIDFDTAALLLDTLNISTQLKTTKAPNQVIANTPHEGAKDVKTPVVTIMGHVDHGKTSLVDYIRSTKVAAKEAGGITQHIGAYQVKTSRGLITFLDTPGHEAFSAMRGRGANITDIIILIIAANDGLKPQTIESIQHAKSTQTPMVVAITKMDIAESGTVDQILSELASHAVVTEAWGGDVPVAKISSKTGEGIDELLELISLQSELLELSAFPDATVSARVCEAKIDRGRGAVITLLIESGTLKKGDILSIGPGYGKVRTMVNALNKPLKSAPPATPVEITGISPLPKAGDSAQAYPDEKSARLAAERFSDSSTNNKSKHSLTLDDLFNKEPEKLQLNLILKADTHGSLEAISTILNDINEEGTEVNLLDAQVGSINSSDVTLAASTQAEIIAFHVSIESTAKKLLDQQTVSAKQFKIIYQLIDHVKESLVRLKGPIMKETSLGQAEVKAVFRSSKFGQIAGCIVTDGTIQRGKMARIRRKDDIIFEGDIASIKREKETLTEARKNTECGLGIKNFAEAAVGDKIECYMLEEDV